MDHRTLVFQERALLAEIAAMADRLRVELEDVRAEVTELKRSSRGEGSK